MARGGCMSEERRTWTESEAQQQQQFRKWLAFVVYQCRLQDKVSWWGPFKAVQKALKASNGLYHLINLTFILEAEVEEGQRGRNPWENLTAPSLMGGEKRLTQALHVVGNLKTVPGLEGQARQHQTSGINVKLWLVIFGLQTQSQFRAKIMQTMRQNMLGGKQFVQNSTAPVIPVQVRKAQY